MHELFGTVLGGITADGYLSAAMALALYILAIVLGMRGTWHTSVEAQLKANREHLTRHDRNFQTLKDKHGLDTPFVD